MEEFEKIKEFTFLSIQSNIKNTNTIKNWKKEIRNSLMRIKEKFN
jgi:hypothetical protein